MHLDTFLYRHLGPTKEDRDLMLSRLGFKSIQDLIEKTIPESIISDEKLDIPEAITEDAYLKHIYQLGYSNKLFKNYIGLGYHDTILPSVIKRNILENPSWYTSYTPYQPEISQGRLEALINFQTMITELTGMEIANASLLDEGTACAEAMLMFYNNRSKKQISDNCNTFVVSEDVFPQTIEILKTKADLLGINLLISDIDAIENKAQIFGVLLQNPGFCGNIKDFSSLIRTLKNHAIKVVIACDIYSLVYLSPPSEWGVDVVVGNTQRFGMPLGFGGPHAAFFATTETFKRSIPGRIIGMSKDKNGKPALRMALQTREQHIKRDKATSNICTAQVLPAIMSVMYCIYHGPKGLYNIANRIHRLAVHLEKGIAKLGVSQINPYFFDTLCFKVDGKKIRKIAEREEFNFAYPQEDKVCIAFNEVSNIEDLNRIFHIFCEAMGQKKQDLEISENHKKRIPKKIEKTTPFLQQRVFNTYHSETEIMRYMKLLEKKDISLTHSMIPLGSCTMKLNAASEMLPLSLPNWANIHPYAPKEQTMGYHTMLNALETYLSEITGFYATSLQPNSGAQGEYAGLMVIRRYQQSINQGHRHICLIPSSAHGTNPASAVISGMRVVVVKNLENGNICLEDLQMKAELHKDNLAALMITYPSTYGVYEEDILKITEMVHQYGGQVYMDGANMNAQVGLTNPKKIGADVCHLNLHKTFSIPHGGGGPGVGPICVAKHLAPFLPKNPQKNQNDEAKDMVSSAPWGNALVCLISYGYIKMLGYSGLKKVSEYAILNANYIKYRLENAYQIIFKGINGNVAHELVIDCRPFKKMGIEVFDIAKRLIDYGYHAPTVSFPIAGTLMIEPTESESLEEIERFCEVMLKIRKEIDTQSSLLKNAPHDLSIMKSMEWDYPYTREDAVFPMRYLEGHKFWPPVSRLNEAYGDRNFICTCGTY